MENKIILVIVILVAVIMAILFTYANNCGNKEHFVKTEDCPNPTPTDIFYNEFVSEDKSEKYVMFRCKLDDGKYYYLSFIPKGLCPMPNRIQQSFESQKDNEEKYKASCDKFSYDCGAYVLALIEEKNVNINSSVKFIVKDVDLLNKITNSSKKKYNIYGLINNAGFKEKIMISQYVYNNNNEIPLLCGVQSEVIADKLKHSVMARDQFYNPAELINSKHDLDIEVDAKLITVQEEHKLNVPKEKLEIKFKMNTINTNNCTQLQNKLKPDYPKTNKTFIKLCGDESDICKLDNLTYKRICLTNIHDGDESEALKFEPIRV